MAKCTGMRCPMQVGYKVEECNHTDCPYRTEPMTNADRIRSMSDEEFNYFLHKVTYGMDECPYEYGSEKSLEWLQQPAEEEAYNETD